MILILYFRDPETGNHLERIRYYAKTLAQSIANSNNDSGEIDRLFIDYILRTSPLHDMARAIILHGKGTHFDPMVIDAFVDCEKAFIHICERFKDC